MADLAEPDYTTMDGPTLLRECRDNAAKWATAFCQHAAKFGPHTIDEGWMIGWFANAIETSSDVRRLRLAASPTPPSIGVTLPSEKEIDALIVQHTGAGCERCGEQTQVGGTYEAARAILQLIERKTGRKP